MHGLCGLDMDVLKQNRSDWCVNMRPARMQQWASKKEPGGREELNKREPDLKMCLPGNAGRGTETIGSQIPAPTAGK